MEPLRSVIKKIQPETGEWPGQPYRFKGRHRRWNADSSSNEHIINRYHEDDRNADDRYRGELWCNDDVEIIDWTDQKMICRRSLFVIGEGTFKLIIQLLKIFFMADNRESRVCSL